jgi:two-component system, OmpR family, response regulator
VKAPSRLLVVEDDAQVRLGLVEGLRAQDYQVKTATSYEEAKHMLSEPDFDLIVLDLVLGDQESWPVLELAVEHGLPVIVLTSRVDVTTRLRAFESGAVDYLSKPFFIAELVARIRLRTGAKSELRERCTFGDAVIDLARRELRVRSLPVSLTPGEFEVLAYLVSRPGRAISRSVLAYEVLPEDSERLERTVDSHVSRLRSKLGDAASHIHTVWGIGWRFEP